MHQPVNALELKAGTALLAVSATSLSILHFSLTNVNAAQDDG
jgi:hypothetical protein